MSPGSISDKRVCRREVIIYSFHVHRVNTEIRYVNCNRKNGRNVYISQSVSLSTHSLYVLFVPACGLYFCSILGNTFGTVCNHRSLGKLSARVSRGGRVDSGEGGQGGDRGGGHMQQVVRFSKPIEIDGFPIPWRTLSLPLSYTLSLTPALRSRGRAYNTPKLLSILQRDGRRDRCESGTSAESRWRGTRELTAFITAFSPCHGFSLRHSLQAIERQAICLPFALRFVIHIALIRLREPLCNFLRVHPIGLLVTSSINYREATRKKWNIFLIV